MSELYWITRLDAICIALGLTIFMLLLAIAFFAMQYYDLREDYIRNYTKKDVTSEIQNIVKRIGKIVLVVVILVIFEVFIPTTKQALVIYGIGGTIDYIKSNNTANQLPDKVISALDKYLDTLNEENDEKDK
jgi:uncharacterized membrane protein